VYDTARVYLVAAAIMATTLFRVTEHTIPTSHIREYPRSTADDQEDVLSLAVKQYTPKENFRAQSEVTVIGGHANGFPKVCRNRVDEMR